MKWLAYRIIDPVKKTKPSLEKKVELNPEAKTGNTNSDLTAQIAERAYELYEQRGRQEGLANQDWIQAEREIRKNKKHNIQ